MDERTGDSQSSMEVDEMHPLDLLNEEQTTGYDAQVTPGAEENANAIQIEKYVIDRADIDKKAPLPEGWALIYHANGLPMYYHKDTNVVTHSKPFQVDGTVRDHDVPISAVPCLFRSVMDEQMKKYGDVALQEECPITAGRKQELWEKKITPEKYREYCIKKFPMEKKTVKRHTKTEKDDEQLKNSLNNSFLRSLGFDTDYEELRKKFDPNDMVITMENGTILIDHLTFSLSSAGKKGTSKKTTLFNPMEMMATQILNLVVQRLCIKKMDYDLTDTKNSIKPYLYTAMLTIQKSSLDEMSGQLRESLMVLSEVAAASGENSENSAGVPPDQKRFAIGSGVGRNLKVARQAAAKDALSKLLPKLRINEEWICDGVVGNAEQNDFEKASRELFKNLKIDDPKVLKVCQVHHVKTPLSLLNLAAKTSMRWAGRGIDFVKEMDGDTSKVTLHFGDMLCEARAVGVSEATNLACQVMLKKMHSDLETYGALLELYDTLEKRTEKLRAQQHQDELARVRDVETKMEPNEYVLKKLREEMGKASLEFGPKRNLYGFQSLLPERTFKDTQTDMEMFSPFPTMTMQPVPHPPPITHWPQSYLPRAQSSNQPIQRPPSPMDHQSQYYSLPPPPPPLLPSSNNWSHHGQSSSRHQHTEAHSSQSHYHDIPKKRTRWDDSPASSSSYSSDRRTPR